MSVKTSSTVYVAVLVLIVNLIRVETTVISQSAPRTDFDSSSNSATTLLSRFIKNSYPVKNTIEEGLRTANLNNTCSQHVLQFWEQIKGLIGNDTGGDDVFSIESWALQMIDAWGKIPEGLLSGHINVLGDFDECLAVRSPVGNDNADPFQGKYCLIYTIPKIDAGLDQTQDSKPGPVHKGERSIENLLKLLTIVGNSEMPIVPSIGTCLPSTCSDDEIFSIVSALLSNLNLLPITSYCSTDEAPKLGTGAITTISFLGVLIMLVFVGTLVDLSVLYAYLPPPPSSNQLFQICKAFSLATNGQKFLNTETSKNDIGCLHGIRFLSASWVVLGHTFFMGTMQPVWNLVDAYSMITTSVPILFITNAPVVVDVFFVMGGFLVSLTLLALLEKTKGNLRSLPMVYLHRYLRITPLYMIIIAFTIFVFPLMGSGPTWHITKTWAGFCEKNWWKNLLYINNLPIYDGANDPLDAPCHGIAWYLGVDMQLFILSPFLLYPILKWKRLGVAPLAILTAVSIVLPGVLTYVNDYPPLGKPFQSATSKYSQEAYSPTYMRAAPYLIGMWAGILYRKMQKLSITKDYRLSPLQVIGAWLIAFTIGFTVLLSAHKFMDPEYILRRGESAIFVVGTRVAWAMAISWLIFACALGYGGWINQILSWRPFVPLGRLTFAIYLVSMDVQFLFHFQYRQPISFDVYHMVNLYFAHLFMSCLVAVVCTLVVEAPFMQLLKILLPTRDGKKNSSKVRGGSNDTEELPRIS
ncbi:unnamed protein product [Orchesella dallaii]|uniref:Nose resistant-to-fluoxetine protein N-terminal domain-containing protein n=1 Tax=Orchesella dallaii TaxID=48710 RepID=A0ABP1RT45_9HEXA